MSCTDPLTGLNANCDDPGYVGDVTIAGGYSTPSVGNLPSSTIAPAPTSGGGLISDITSIAGNLGNIAQNLYKSTLTPTSTFSPTSTPSAPYPVVSNGQVIGYSSAPTAPITSTSSSSGLILILVVGLGALLLFRK